MRLKTLDINGFKSFAHKTILEFPDSIVAVVGPNGSGKSNVVEAIRFVLGEQSMKSMRGKLGLDLIFKGSKKLSQGSHAKVTIHFNNSDKVFKLSNEGGENINLDFDTISIGREVYGDGLNKYILNGSEVRLKDIHNLLASVNVGSSGHHIISQGEADRILNASPKDRKEMVEDALGLKIYQWKIKEAERKLERTEANMKEVSLLRRENAPHLNFLKKQVEKLEKAKEMQAELSLLYKVYLKQESIYLEKEKHHLAQDKNKIEGELSSLNKQIALTEGGGNKEENEKIKELRNIETKIHEIHGVKSEIERKLGRIEGMIEALEHRSESVAEVVEISSEEMKKIVSEINSSVDEAISKHDFSEIQGILRRIKEIINRFNQQGNSSKEDKTSEIENYKTTQRLVLAEMNKVVEEEKKLSETAEKLKQEITEVTQKLRDQEREKFSLKVRHQELTSALELISVKEINLSREIEAFETEIREGQILIGVDILSYKNYQVDGVADRHIQEEQKRKIERIKIKLEDAGLGGGGDLMKEYKEMTERDQFLEKELADLTASMEMIEKLIADLKEKIDIEFKEGIKKINVEFQEFFSLMFGGGHGSLNVIMENKRRRKDEEDANLFDDDDIIFEQGIEINVSLPHKKVKELHALSGGERSLTSIALLFAMSQVNPPPFLVLDETDAALDEANSRKYGDMLEKLSKHSQLIVVTHNRETMSRAGILYGVTIGADGASKLLSVKFDEATAIAK
ncbi:MAG: AAA family ATPase [Candidatus Paceibacterota bacterium]|jgi:chromosome segregation protein